MPRASRSAPPIEIILPATSANIGPGFDSAAMALRLFQTVRAQKSDHFGISAVGRDSDICGAIDDNLVIATYIDALKSQGKAPVPLKITVENEIPIGKGLGSSAAARLAAIALAVHFGDLRWTDDRIVAEAAAREKHPDNVAACWFGGVVLAHGAHRNGSATPHIDVIQLNARNRWPILLAITDKGLATESARAVLPDRYSRADLVSSLQSAMLLTAAFVKGRADLLRNALKDCIHEPYRKALCPLLEPLQSIAGTSGVLGAVLSGAGPSVLMVLDPKASPDAVMKIVQEALRARHVSAELLLTRVAGHGARERIRRVRRVTSRQERKK